MKMSTDFVYSGEFVPYDTRFEMPREVYLRIHPTAPFHELEDITMQIGLSGRVVLGVKLKKSTPAKRDTGQGCK